MATVGNFAQILSKYIQNTVLQTFITLEIMHYCSIPQREMLYIVICSQKCVLFFLFKE